MSETTTGTGRTRRRAAARSTTSGPVKQLRYNTVQSRIWGEAWFRQLSLLAQMLVLRLLIGKQTTSLPCLVEHGRADLAEQLGVSPEGFDEVFGELVAKASARADWGARVVFLPFAWSHNRPQSPNVVKGWRRLLDELPDSDVKSEGLRYITSRVCELPESFRKAFAWAFGDLAEAFATSSDPDPQPQPYPQVEEALRASSARAHDAATPTFGEEIPLEPVTAPREQATGQGGGGPAPSVAPAATPQGAPAAAAEVSSCLELWRAAYGASRRPYGPYSQNRRDAEHAAVLVELARPEAAAEAERRGAPAATVMRELLEHQMREYLADNAPLLVEKRHPLALLPDWRSNYGTPWKQAKPRATVVPIERRPAPEAAPLSAAETVAGARAALSSIGVGPGPRTARPAAPAAAAMGGE